MANKIQVRRGIKADLPTLDLGEFGLTTDTSELYIGCSSGNVSLAAVASGLTFANVTGTPVDNQLAVWTTENVIEGTSSLTFDGSDLSVDGGVQVGSAGTTAAGVVQWDGSNFQGYTGSEWIDLDSQGTGTIDGSGINNQLAFWRDSNTLSGHDDLQWDGTILSIGGGPIAGQEDGGLHITDSTPSIVFKDTDWSNSKARIRGCGYSGSLWFEADPEDLVEDSQISFFVDDNLAGTIYKDILKISGTLRLGTPGMYPDVAGSIRWNGSRFYCYNGSSWQYLDTFQHQEYIGVDDCLTFWEDFRTLGTTNIRWDGSLLKFVGTTSSYPALKRNADSLEIRLADDSDYADLVCSGLTCQEALVVGPAGTTIAGAIQWDGSNFQGYTGAEWVDLDAGGAGVVDGSGGANYIAHWSDSDTLDGDSGLQWNGTLLQFGGTTNAHPALKRNTSVLDVKLADDSGYAVIRAANFNSSTNSTSMRAGEDGLLYWNNSSRMRSSANGNIDLRDNTNASFNLLQFGGTTNAYPALRRNESNLEIRLADDSAHTDLICSGIECSGLLVDGDLYTDKVYTTDMLLDGGLLQFSGETNAYPALKRVSNFMQVRLADDSDAANLTAGNFYGDKDSSSFRAGEDGFIFWTGRSAMKSFVNGNIAIGMSGVGSWGSGETDFGLLQFGGITNAYPALKRSGTDLQARLADDSEFTSFECSGIDSHDSITVPNDKGFYCGSESGDVAFKKDSAGTATIVNVGTGTGNLRVQTLLTTSRVKFTPNSIIRGGTTSADIRITNESQNDFGLLQFGGESDSYPALKRNSTAIDVRLADDTDYADLNAGDITSDGFSVTVVSGVPEDDQLAVWVDDSTIEGTTGLRYNGTTLSVFGGGSFNGSCLASGSVRAGNFIFWLSKSVMASPVDGNITLTNQTETDFDLLQLGGTTSSCPALKRNGAAIDVRLADDTDYADLACNNVTVEGNVGIGTTSPSALLEIETTATISGVAVEIDQNDDDEAFINYAGTSASDSTKNISTMNGDGSVEGPKNRSGSNGWNFEGMVKVEVNGSEYWMPYFSPDLA